MDSETMSAKSSSEVDQPFAHTSGQRLLSAAAVIRNGRSLNATFAFDG
jgi:hypothetical protein